MQHMDARGQPSELLQLFFEQDEQTLTALRLAQAAITQGGHSKQIEEYQAAALYCLAGQYNYPDAAILEIGTYYGYSAAILALAAPLASVITLNPADNEYPIAVSNLKRFGNVQVIKRHSWDYFNSDRLSIGQPYQMVFVDGDHKRIRNDLVWWERVAANGLMLFHDYTPLGSPRHCPPVYDGLNAWLPVIGRQAFDVSIIDAANLGMVGLYK